MTMEQKQTQSQTQTQTTNAPQAPVSPEKPAENVPAKSPNAQEATPNAKADEREVGLCESCNQERPLNDVPHHQDGNDKVWKYCDACTEVHEKEVKTLAALKELRNTHPEAVNDPKVAGYFNAGKTLDEVKKILDTTKQPSLEAEVEA